MDQQLPTAIEFLDKIKERRGLKTDYQLAKVMGVPQQTLSHWRRGRVAFSDETCAKVGELLDLPAGYVAACIHHHRSNEAATKIMWATVALLVLRYLDKLSSTAAALVAAILLVFAVSFSRPVNALERPAVVNAITGAITHGGDRCIHYAQGLMNAARRLARAVLGACFGGISDYSPAC